MTQPYLRCSDSTKCFFVSMSHHQVKLLQPVSHQLGTYSLTNITFTLSNNFWNICRWIKNLFLCFIYSVPTPIVGSNLTQIVSFGGDPPMDICNDSLTIESYGFSQRCVESNILERDSRWFENSIMGSGHTFPNAAEFRDVMYLMSIAGRFRYCFTSKYIEISMVGL